MSYAEMRTALEAVQGDMEEFGHIRASTGKQVDDALKSEPTTSELVSELRKRDGVDAYDVPTGGCYDLDIYSTQLRRIRDILHSELDIHGKAIILRITD